MTGTQTTPTAQGFAQIILVASNKGGVLKSSMVASLSAELASKGQRVLVIDGDLQGNVSSRDFGVEGDRGRGLAMTMQFGAPLVAVPARKNLDVVPGGVHLAGIPASMAAQAAAVGPADGTGATALATNLGEALDSIVANEQYNVVVIDAGPGDVTMLEGYMQIANWLVVPTHEDEGSIDGVKFVASRMLVANERGANIDLLGVVLTGVNARAQKRKKSTIDTIGEMFGDPDAVFESTVTYQRASATDMRKHNLVPADLHTGEFERRVEAGEFRRGDLWSRDFSRLVADYKNLTLEVINRLVALSQDDADGEAPVGEDIAEGEEN